MTECHTINCSTCGFQLDETFVEQKCPRCQTIIESKFVCGSCHHCGETLNKNSQPNKENFFKKVFSIFQPKLPLN